MSRIHLTIDQLALKGFDAAHRKALVEGLQGELSRVLCDPTTRAKWRSHRKPVLRLEKMRLDPHPSGSRKFGIVVARAIGKGLEP